MGPWGVTSIRSGLQRPLLSGEVSTEHAVRAKTRSRWARKETNWSGSDAAVPTTSLPSGAPKLAAGGRPSESNLQHNFFVERTAMSENTETAILAGGCFWPAQELLRHRDGVFSTRVGYTGGENENPTADNHPGHAEAVEVIFDPERTSYRNILEFFFQIHRPDLGEAVVGSD